MKKKVAEIINHFETQYDNSRKLEEKAFAEIDQKFAERHNESLQQFQNLRDASEDGKESILIQVLGSEEQLLQAMNIANETVEQNMGSLTEALAMHNESTQEHLMSLSVQLEKGDSLVRKLEETTLKGQGEQQAYSNQLAHEIKNAITTEAKNNNIYFAEQIQNVKDELNNGVNDMKISNGILMKERSAEIIEHSKEQYRNYKKLEEKVFAEIEQKIIERHNESIQQLRNLVNASADNKENILAQVLGSEERILQVMNTAKGAVEQNLEVLAGELTTNNEDVQGHFDSLSAQLEKSNSLINSVVTENITRLEAVLLEVQRVNHDACANVDALDLKVQCIQLKMIELFNQVLDGLDNVDEKGKGAYNRIFNQVSGLSKKIGERMEQVHNSIEMQEALFSESTKRCLEADGNQLDKLDEMQKEIVARAITSDENQVELQKSVERLQEQVEALNALASFLKNQISTESQSQKSNQKKPNRIEEIVDKDSGITACMHYSDNHLTKNEMYRDKRKVYEVEYDVSGNILKTKNYDRYGNVTTELQFYKNGQVRTRTERVTAAGKTQQVITRFDNKGNKLN